MGHASNILFNLGTPSPKRRVFFSFHFDDDIMRVNTIRNSGEFLETKGHFDGSLWEEAKKQGDVALKRLINTGLENTTATCILYGTYTYSRPWVRYEIAKSVARGNGLFSVNISNVECARQKRQNPLMAATCIPGPDPLAFMGVGRRGDKFYLIEADSRGNWVWYDKFIGAVPCPSYLGAIADGSYKQLAQHTAQYIWTNSHHDLSKWANIAAVQAGR